MFKLKLRACDFFNKFNMCNFQHRLCCILYCMYTINSLFYKNIHWNYKYCRIYLRQRKIIALEKSQYHVLNIRIPIGIPNRVITRASPARRNTCLLLLLLHPLPHPKPPVSMLPMLRLWSTYASTSRRHSSTMDTTVPSPCETWKNLTSPRKNLSVALCRQEPQLLRNLPKPSSKMA